MALLTGYYNSVNGDRKYNAETMSKYFAGLFTRGVLQNYKNKLSVQAVTGMQVKVSTGKAYFTDGKWIENTADMNFTIDQSEVTLNRIDIIVIRNDKGESVRNSSIILKKGTPATSPVAPSLEKTETVEEMCIAEIRVNKLVESITQSNITNTIPDTSKCGYVTGLIDQVDTSDLYNQYQSAMNEYLEESRNTFDSWFNDVKDTLSTTMLLRQFETEVTTATEGQTDIVINQPNYNYNLDILEVFVNGMRLIKDIHYTNEQTYIKLKKPLLKDQEVQLVILKSVDGAGAETVVKDVEDLTEEVAKLSKYNYYCTGANDNQKLSQIAQNFLGASGEFQGMEENAEIKINVIGTLVATETLGGTGTAEDPYYWFNLGKNGSTANSTRKITFDFTYCNRISLGSQASAETIAFVGNDVNIIGLNFVIGGSGSTLKWFNGQNINIRDSQLYLNAEGVAMGSQKGGFFERCRLSVTSVSAKATALNSDGTTILKAVDCEIYCYNSTSVSDESIAVLGEANKTEGVVIVERCNIPLKTRNGYKQSQTVKINSGYASLVSNTLGKAPALYDQTKCTQVGSMIISK